MTASGVDYEGDVARIARRGGGLRRASWVFCGLAALAFIISSATGVPPYGGAISFTDVQIHPALEDHFREIGVVIETMKDHNILGVSQNKISSGLGMVDFLVTLAAIGSLLRLQWRWALGAFAVSFVLFFVGSAVRPHDGYKLASFREFGVHNARPRPVLPTVTDTGRPNDKAGEADPFADGRAWARKKLADQDTHATLIRAQLAGDMSDFPGQQRGAAHYTRAQIGYLEENLPDTVRELNAIRGGEFQSTWVADYRLRIMREWARARGAVIDPTAYHPMTGFPLAWMRLFSRAAAVCGGTLLLITLAVFELSRTMRRRATKLEDWRRQLDRPGCSDVEEGAFGRRLALAGIQPSSAAAAPLH